MSDARGRDAVRRSGETKTVRGQEAVFGRRRRVPLSALGRRERRGPQHERDRTDLRRDEHDQGDKRERFGETRRAAAFGGGRRYAAAPDGDLVIAERCVTRGGGPSRRGEAHRGKSLDTCRKNRQAGTECLAVR